MGTHILITGGTGSVGSEIVRQLAMTGASIRVLARRPEKAQAAPAGVAYVAADLARPETLAPAMEGVSTMLLLSGMSAEQAVWQSNAVQAAKRAGVRRVVKISAIGADLHSPIALCRWHAQTEAELASSGMEHINIRPNFFMQNMLGFAGTIREQGAFYACARDGRASIVDVRDIAAVAVACLTQEGHDGEIYLVTGPEALSFVEQAAKLSAAIGKPVRYVDLPPQEFRKALLGTGRPEWLAEALTGLYLAAADGMMAPVTDTVREVTGKAAITFDDFAREFAPHFRGQGTAA
jgi:uncharacterized protein YbjT (DUF2867 family)